MPVSILTNLNENQINLFSDLLRRGIDEQLTVSELREIIIKEIPALQSIHRRTLFDHIRKFKEEGPPSERKVSIQPVKPIAPSVVGDSTQMRGTGSDSAELDIYSTQRITTVEEALAKGDVDLARWDVERFVLNSWEVGAKGPDGKVLVTPLWQVKIWLKAKKGWNPSEFRKLLIDDIKALPTEHPPRRRTTKTEPMLAELSIFDAHFGKLAWSPETGQNYDIDICRDRYMTAGRDLIDQALNFNIEKLLFVVGNDFFHVDHKSMTTNGTPQDCDGRWQKAFRVGKDCVIALAEEAANECDVDIICVPGNHDKEKVFCLGEVLAARFENHPSINVINEPDVFNYYRWGNVLLGFVHGDNHTSAAKRAELPGQMMTDRPKDCGETIWREWHLGHRHFEQEMVWKYLKADCIRDIVVRTLPSLSSTDAWHRSNGYCSVLAAEIHLYHKEKGRRGYFVHCADGKVK